MTLAGCSPEGRGTPARDPAAARAAYGEALGHFRREELDLAVEQGRRAIAADPELAEAHWVLGKVLFFMSDVVVGTPTRDDTLLKEAAAELQSASELAPENAEYAYWTGRALALLGDPAAATANFQAVLALDARHGAAYKQLAMVQRDAGQDARAGEAFELAVRYLPDDGDLWFQYGMHLEMNERTDEARAAYERSRELDWTVPRTYSRLAVLLRQTGDTEGADEASAQFERWSEFGRELNELLTLAHEDRSNVSKLMAVGEHYVEARRYQAAAAWFKRACLADPSDQAARAALRSAEAELGSPAKASTPTSSGEEQPS